MGARETSDTFEVPDGVELLVRRGVPICTPDGRTITGYMNDDGITEVSLGDCNWNYTLEDIDRLSEGQGAKHAFGIIFRKAVSIHPLDITTERPYNDLLAILNRAS